MWSSSFDSQLHGNLFTEWLFLVPLKGGRWHIIAQLAVYTTYILLSGGLYNPYHLLGELWNNHWFHWTNHLGLCYGRPLYFLAQQLVNSTWRSKARLPKQICGRLWTNNSYQTNFSYTLPKTNIAIENPPFWWYLQGNMGIFMGYVSFTEGSTWSHHLEFKNLKHLKPKVGENQIPEEKPLSQQSTSPKSTYPISRNRTSCHACFYTCCTACSCPIFSNPLDLQILQGFTGFQYNQGILECCVAHRPRGILWIVNGWSLKTRAPSQNHLPDPPHQKQKITIDNK